MTPISTPAVFPNITAWQSTLQSISAQPLEYSPNFPEIARRFDAWWAHDATDRPILIASTNGNPSRPIDRRLDLLFQPERWMEAKLLDMKQTHRVGDALPHIRPDFGPVMLSALFGGNTEFVADTTWTHAFIADDWSNCPDWSIENHPWWHHLIKLTEMIIEDAPGKYLYHTPNIGASADILLNLRGSSQLCLDVIDQPQKILQAIDAIYPAWYKAFDLVFGAPVSHKVGVIHHPMVWSSVPHSVFECDFNYMIGKKDFIDLFLPDIARQAGAVGRAIFHLDGPGARKHLDALLDTPEIQAIQYVPGAGTPSALPWIDMYKRILKAGKSVQVVCPAEDVLKVCDELPREGLCFLVSDAPSVKDLDDLYEAFCKKYN